MKILAKILLIGFTIITFYTPTLAQRREGHALQGSSNLSQDQEANQQARQFWDARITQCGEDYFTRNRYSIRQFKNLQIIVTALGVTQADRLNGIEWQGRTVVKAEASRLYSSKRTVNEDIGWSKWSQGLGDALEVVGLIAEIRKENGQWLVLPSRISPVNNLQPVDCSNPEVVS